MLLFKKYTIPLILLSLVLTITYLSYYNYKTQKNLLLVQMHNNSSNIAGSVSSAIERFHDIKSTVNLQKLVDDVSFGLDIFEFRYLDRNGVIQNSMFKEEIGQVLSSNSFHKTMKGEGKLNTFFFEVRDFVNVMSIYYPIYESTELIGIIDLSVDISEYNLKKGSRDNFSILRRQVDIRNLLKSINGSITNSLAILTKTNINDFLHAYVDSTKNITQISIIDKQHKVQISSDKSLIGTSFNGNKLPPPGIAMINGTYTYLSIIDTHPYHDNSNMVLLLLTDASTFANHEKKLLQTAVLTSFLALLFALFTSRLIYYSAIEESREETERLEHLVNERTREIELLSKTDALTGLWNRRYLEEMLDMEFKKAKRYKPELSILFIDLDHFKKINDTFGHMAGDEVLRQASNIIKKCQRKTDFIGRYGGEEIVVILPGTSAEQAEIVAKTIVDAIAEIPIEFESQIIYVTASVGISSLREDHHDYLMIFAEADEALYSAKELGRNRVEVFKQQPA